MEHKTHCFKHSQHEKFIPVNDFSEADLPNNFITSLDKPEVCDLVRQQADLTVRIRVKNVCAKRSGQDSGTRFKRLLGSGWVQNVRAAGREEVCPCAVCRSTNQKSPEPWFVIEVKTAAHVVYDSEEAKSTFVDLFYDEDFETSEEREGFTSCVSRTNWRKAKQLQCVGLMSSSLHLDVAVLKCITHDVEIYHRLQSALALLSRQTTKLTGRAIHGEFGKYPVRYSSQAVIRNMRQFRYQQSMAIVVSHPHGLPKQVTIGALQGKIFSTDFESSPKQVANKPISGTNCEDCTNFSNRVQDLSLSDSPFYNKFRECALLKILADDNKLDRSYQRSKEEYSVQLKNCLDCVCFSEKSRNEANFTDYADEIVNFLKFSINGATQKLDRPKRKITWCDEKSTTNFSKFGFSCHSKHDSESLRIAKLKAHLQNVQESFILQHKQYNKKLHWSRARYLYAPEYDTATCPGSSGAPVFIYSPEISSPRILDHCNRPRCQRVDEDHDNEKSCDVFHTHCTWRRVDSECDMRPPCLEKTSSLKLDERQQNSSFCKSYSYEDLPSQPSQKQRRDKKLGYQSPGPPSHDQDNQSDSFFDRVFKVLSEALKTLYSYLWPSSSDLKCAQTLESEMESILVMVKFPKGEYKMCEIFFNMRLVKEEKERLMNSMNEDYGSPDNYSLLLFTASNGQEPIPLDDESVMLMYCNEMADDSKLVFEAKQDQVIEIGPSLGISLKL